MARAACADEASGQKIIRWRPFNGFARQLQVHSKGGYVAIDHWMVRRSTVRIELCGRSLHFFENSHDGFSLVGSGLSLS